MESNHPPRRVLRPAPHLDLAFSPYAGRDQLPRLLLGSDEEGGRIYGPPHRVLDSDEESGGIYRPPRRVLGPAQRLLHRPYAEGEQLPRRLLGSGDESGGIYRPPRRVLCSHEESGGIYNPPHLILGSDEEGGDFYSPPHRVLGSDKESDGIHLPPRRVLGHAPLLHYKPYAEGDQLPRRLLGPDVESGGIYRPPRRVLWSDEDSGCVYRPPRRLLGSDGERHRVVLGPDEKGIKTTVDTKCRLDESGKMVKVITTSRSRVIRKAVSARAAAVLERRSWDRFGDAAEDPDGSYVTVLSNEEITFAPPSSRGISPALLLSLFVCLRIRRAIVWRMFVGCGGLAARRVHS
jgi:hypothetical protein